MHKMGDYKKWNNGNRMKCSKCCTVWITPWNCCELEDHHLEERKTRVTLIMDQKKTLSHQQKTAERKVSVIPEYEGINAPGRKPGILVSVCTTLLWDMVHCSDQSH